MTEFEILTYPQEQLTKEERKINIFIQKEIYNSEYVTEAHCNIDPESGLTEICYNTERKNYFSKYENTLLLPIYLNPENAIKNEEFFEKIVYNSSLNNESYNNQKEKFLEKTISYDDWHISSFDIVPNYCANNDIINQVILKAIKENKLSRKEYVDKLKNYKNIQNEFDLLLTNAYDKSVVLYLILNKTEQLNEDNVVCFFNKSKK